MAVAWIPAEPLTVGDLVWVVDHEGEAPPAAVEVLCVEESRAKVTVCGVDPSRTARNAYWEQRDNLARKRVA